MQCNENLTDGATQTIVHGEAFAVPVARGTQTAQLTSYGATGIRLPRPYPLDELFAAEIVARNKVPHPGFVPGGAALQVLSAEAANG